MIERRTTVLPGDRVVARVRGLVVVIDASAADAPAAVPALLSALGGAAPRADWVDVIARAAAPGLSFGAVEHVGSDVRVALAGAGTTIAIFATPGDVAPEHVLTGADGPGPIERVATLAPGNVVTVTVGPPSPPAGACRPTSLALYDGAVPGSGVVVWQPPVGVPRATGPQAGPKSEPFPVVRPVDPVPSLPPEQPDPVEGAAGRVRLTVPVPDAPATAAQESLPPGADPADVPGAEPGPGDKSFAPTDMDLAAVGSGERATISGPLVTGRRCAFGHLNAPDAAFCTRCGALVDKSALTETGPRPPLGTLVADDGSAYVLQTDVVIGRDPAPFLDRRGGRAADGVGRAVGIALSDRTGALSRAHLELRLDGWTILAVDVGSANGTWVRPPGVPAPFPLAPRQPVALAIGSEIHIGGRVLVLQANDGG
ncbi:FHA domain-containing protein [Tsukamurella soli]|uniref:FHA domain-containing protein n=1 Tax=Tsukamurella soli TaxID=644556 RepID=A0ABP8J1L1_9ACTN